MPNLPAFAIWPLRSDRKSTRADIMSVELAVIKFGRLSGGGFIDIVDVDERLLVKPATTNIVVIYQTRSYTETRFLKKTGFLNTVKVLR